MIQEGNVLSVEEMDVGEFCTLMATSSSRSLLEVAVPFAIRIEDNVLRRTVLEGYKFAIVLNIVRDMAAHFGLADLIASGFHGELVGNRA